MKLADFVKMWTDDGFTLSEQEQKIVGEQQWILYNVSVPYFASDYGRHMAIIVVVSTKTNDILAHDDINTSPRTRPDINWTQAMFNWFENYVTEFGGKPIA
jgi:hypothetical protein